jgi:predicted secreted protein
LEGYTVTTVTIGYDTEFAVASLLAPTTFVDLVEVFEVTPPEAAVDQIRATHYKSPGRAHEFVPALTDNGSASVSMNYVPGSATDTLIRALLTSGDVVPMRITYPNAETVTFSGFVVAYSQTVPLDDRMTADMSVKIAGAVTVS